MKLSRFGEKFTSRSGILSLMDDLGNAASDPNTLMLGGGNPAVIPEMQSLFERRLRSIMDTPKGFEHVVASYDPPDGDRAFRDSLARLLNNSYGWPVTRDHIALCNGSQSAFFMLFNLLAGPTSQGSSQQIVLPLTPEYIGYSDAGIETGHFLSFRPSIEMLENRQFKYHVDFASFEVPQNAGALCVSRPTNPTGNVLTDGEVEHLAALAQQSDIPLIIDSAYGQPFPNIVFSESRPFWQENVILTLSLSKLGLPGVRTGIVIADTWVIECLAGINAIVNLATGGFGPALVHELVENAEILSLSTRVIKPYYQSRAQQAATLVTTTMRDLDVYVHKPEGTFFLWVWFKDLPISSQELYERLKAKGVLILAGQHFFPGLAEPWQHKHECIRINYSQNLDTVRAGIEHIAHEARAAYRAAS